jgi:signal transduction histidine kinase
MPTDQDRRICVGARLFAILVIGAPVLWYRDAAGLVAMVVLAGVWTTASLRSDPWQRTWIAPLAEAAAVALVVGISLTASPAMVLALALPPFLAAIRGGIRLTLGASAVQVAVVVAVAVGLQLPANTEQVLNVFTWAMAGLGLGLIGSFVHATAARDADELASYLDAQRLIRQLLDLSGDLSSGLDVTSLTGSVVSDVRDVLPTSALGIYLPRGELLMPLVTMVDDPDEQLGEAEALAVESWARGEPIVHDRYFAFPLGDAAVVAGLLSRQVELPTAEVERSILGLDRALKAKAVQLDTALLFSDFRDLASADVRKRLAREMHDGVAQDIASLGYLVDALAARPADDKQAAQLAMLRERITKIVAEVRQSVLTLRTSIGESQSLGAAIGSVARHLSESSGVPIQVTLDEQSTRLRMEIEAELFRIAQEAMNNAIKHAQCSSIEVVCQVQAPRALITVTDDGRGLQQARSDSHGLKIMRERARLIGAQLDIGDNPTGGLVVTVRVGAPDQSFPRPANAERVTS